MTNESQAGIKRQHTPSYCLTPSLARRADRLFRGYRSADGDAKAHNPFVAETAWAVTASRNIASGRSPSCEGFAGQGAIGSSRESRAAYAARRRGGGCVRARQFVRTKPTAMTWGRRLGGLLPEDARSVRQNAGKVKPGLGQRFVRLVGCDQHQIVWTKAVGGCARAD